MPPAKKAPAKKASAKKETTKAQKALNEDYFEAGSIGSMTGSYLITMEDPEVDKHDAWFIPDGTKSLKSKGIRLVAEGVGIKSALATVGDLLEQDIANAEQADDSDGDDATSDDTAE